MNKANRIVEFLTAGSEVTLFAGAGLSARAGVPPWGPLLHELAQWLQGHDVLVAQKMLELVKKYDYLKAAEFFFMADGVTDKERYARLIAALTPRNSTAIDSLFKLPFTCAITTNFDRLLFDGFANVRKVAPKDYKRGDVSFRNATFAEPPFVCRIHGAIEDPTEIVLTQTKFGELERDEHYKDVLTQAFKSRRMLMMGFSFADPAILSILRAINKSYGPLAVGNHLAIMPSDADDDTKALLNRLNIEALYYDHSASDKSHDALWALIDEVGGLLSSTAVVDKVAIDNEVTLPFDSAKQYLAACYARADLGAGIHPLREVIVEGMVSSIVQRSHPNSVPFKDVVSKIHADTNLSLDESKRLVTAALTAMTGAKLCLWHRRAGEQKVTWQGSLDGANKLERDINTLVDSALNRAFVEEGYRPTSDVRSGLQKFFAQLVLQRGWDLGAAFAAGKVPKALNIDQLMFSVCRTQSTTDIQRMIRVCERLIHNPTVADAEILGALGRASFGLELALQAPRSNLLFASTLPSRIYLDANVIMPAFVEGHTYHKIYSQTIAALANAADGYNATKVFAIYEYLNEVVSHRRLAMQQFEENKESFKEDVIREAMFSGATNMNVFVGAYANLIHSGKSMEFDTFLQTYAPYTSEDELSIWLTERNVYVVKRNIKTAAGLQAEASLQLQKAYANMIKTDKDARLIEHDARQLSLLASDVDAGHRAILVTADRRLREAVASSNQKRLAEHMVSHIGLTQLVDLLVGSPADTRSLSHLIWDSPISERSNEVRQYFIGMALRRYDEAIALEMPSLVDKFVDEVMVTAKRKGLDPASRTNGEQGSWFRVAGSFEDQFFEAIKEQMERREGQR
ncbi:SIR2 family NAD-dependent protein deacylase [Massilia rhizosphaerae]|uniref:SIR2 family NAD-dependent protein deacylase n=1 Tax=Massilia rhizosphaerae TaxID=2784389 RepID=UPI001E2B028C|nr:SIR2 family protein [Massilia rhizosphaerae]